MGENNICCTWKVATNSGKNSPTVSELRYETTAGYGAGAYQCVLCTNEQAMKLVRENIVSAGWAGKVY